MLSSQKPSAARLEAAAEAFKTIVKGRPDYRAENTDYAVGFTECLSYLTDEEIGWLTDPREGLSTVCEYLPTAADVHKMIRERKERRDQFKPAPTAYRRIDMEPGPWDAETDYERKQRVVRELLGYNPAAKDNPLKRELVPATADDLANLRLKTPPAPISRELLAMLKAEGWPHIPGETA